MEIRKSDLESRFLDLHTLINFMEQFQNGVSGFKRFLEIMDEKPETDAEDAVELNARWRASTM